jgi:hypothetical protein
MPKNITNGEFIVNYNEEDRVDENFKFMRAPNTDSLEILRNENVKADTNYYIESNITLMKIYVQESFHKFQRLKVNSKHSQKILLRKK